MTPEFNNVLRAPIERYPTTVGSQQVLRVAHQMALRFLQIYVPENEDSKIDEVLEGLEVLATWRDTTADDRIVVQLLVPAELSESIMDRFERAYAHCDGFRVVLFPVEATLPRLEHSNGESRADQETLEPSKNTFGESGRISREELYNDITEKLGVNRVFVAMTTLSAVVAALGLLRNDVAVIIGAMVIAPLLGPNVAMSLAATLGDVPLLRRSLFTNIVGVTLALIVSFAIGVTSTVDPTITAIAARTGLRIDDLALALAAGSAGTFAFTRGLPGAVIGVMVAVALMPPLVTFGMLLGAGHFVPALGALLLTVANVVCINLAGVATFLFQGVRPRTWWQDKQAKRSSRLAIIMWFSLLTTLAFIIYVTQMSESLHR